MANDKKYYSIKARSASRKLHELRTEGNVPGVIYGGTLKGGQPFEIQRSVLNDMFKSNTKSSVIDIDYDGDKGSVIVREVQRDPVSGEIIHIDLQAIRRDEVLTLPIPILYLGEDEVNNRRLIVNTNLTELEVRGPANEIPESVEIDLKGKTLEDRMEASMIQLPEGIELVTSADELLYTITESRMEASLEAMDEEQDRSEEGPELVETRKKSEE
ncbi:LSU ribosomal protein L25p [Clostridiaceae bacterium JG1575]|nr:LSU ribosomal protein L25p [Clostridiaceae bacterium JG1575]